MKLKSEEEKLWIMKDSDCSQLIAVKAIGEVLMALLMQIILIQDHQVRNLGDFLAIKIIVVWLIWMELSMYHQWLSF